jgi:DNA-binding Lrp family transcriptional regulator
MTNQKDIPSTLNPRGLALDATDRELLALLQSNARDSTANLARRLGLARTTVLARLARLERLEVIEGYGVRLGQAVKASSLAAYVSIAVLPRAGPMVLKALARLIEVEQLSAVSGEFDYIALVRCRSPEHLDETLDAIGALDGVRQTHSSIVLAQKIDRRALTG